jgi:hypothetical protein
MVCDVNFTIVPPHGKNKNWKGSGRVPDFVCRALNAKAHGAAWGTVQAVLADCRPNPYGEWNTLRGEAVNWQRKAIKLATEVHSDFAAKIAARV